MFVETIQRSYQPIEGNTHSPLLELRIRHHSSSRSDGLSFIRNAKDLFGCSYQHEALPHTEIRNCRSDH